jgi:hypothetical protein
LQHTPSTHIVDAHCVPLVHGCPLTNETTHTCGVTVVSQRFGATQSVSEAHVVPHVGPVHT